MNLVKNKSYGLGFIFITAIVFGVANNSRAQSRCDNMQSQADMNGCAIEEYKNADAQLNAAYQRLTYIVSPERKAKLTQAQLAWIQFRDNQCLFELTNTRGGRSNGVEGSMAPIIRYSCLKHWTEKRTNDFNQYIQSQLPKPTRNRSLEDLESGLNIGYELLHTRISGEARNNLQASQSSWSVFLNLNCQFEATFAAIGQDLCLRRMAQERAEWFTLDP
ncbi:MAG: lysozyme inhibitor LprI family protein [Planktothrix sp.]|uniref:lysozyme inhibitor LprI family protein n=1 Tax=Planktothrix sp. TaxID=3088171 RepID=UPI0038D3D51D